ncbi:uncharacterized protein METZ01_LOCUS208275, partial [marine metagenome]
YCQCVPSRKRPNPFYHASISDNNLSLGYAAGFNFEHISNGYQV